MQTSPRSQPSWMLLAPLLLCAACSGAVTPAATDAQAHRATTGSTAGVESNGPVLNGASLNGASLNGASLNGSSLNGASLNGASLNGASLNGASLNGASLNGASLNGTLLGATQVDGTVLSGSALTGSLFAGILDDGRTLPLRLDAVRPNADPARAEVWLYQVSFHADEGWKPLCGTDAAGAPVLATALAGRWDYRVGAHGGGDFIDDPHAFTFACMAFALGKCVELGYEPWKTVRRCEGPVCVDVPLRSFHQACTRMLRADYCGDGSPHTVNGTLIDVYDALGIQVQTDQTAFEAEWDGGGARCVSRARVGSLPRCATHLRGHHCGSTEHFESGTLLMDRHQPGEVGSGE